MSLNPSTFAPLWIIISLLSSETNSQNTTARMQSLLSPKIALLASNTASFCKGEGISDNWAAQVTVAVNRIRSASPLLVNSYIAFNSNRSATKDWIKDMKWPVILLLTGMSVVMLIFFVSLGLTFFHKISFENNTLGKCFFMLTCLKLVLFVGLFVVFMIFMALSVVNFRRSRCQLLNVGNMLTSGINNPLNGNQYVGFQTMFNSALGAFLELQYMNATTSFAKSIIGSNFPQTVLQSTAALNNILVAFGSQTTSNGLGLPDQGYSLGTLSQGVPPIIAQEFNNLILVGSSLTSAAKSLVYFSSQTNLTQTAVQASFTQLISFLADALNSFASASLNLYNSANDQYKYVSSGYWTLFALYIIILILLVMILVSKFAFMNNLIIGKPIFGKVLFLVVCLLVVIFGCIIIVLMSGSLSVSSFCSVLTQLNQKNVGVLDQLNVTWTPYTKQALKQCIAGNNGNLLNAFYGSNFAAGGVNIDDFQNLINGMLNYKAIEMYPMVANSSAIKFNNANYTLVIEGIIEDNINIIDQVSALSADIAQWVFYFSLTNYNCTINASPNICVPIDISTTSSPAFSVFTLGNHTIKFTNLQSYIRSEQIVLTKLIAAFDSKTSGSPNQIFVKAKSILDNNMQNYLGIIAVLNKTMAPFANFSGQASQLFDCRNINRELLILEDYSCFRLDYWVQETLIIAGTSFILLGLIILFLVPVVFRSRSSVEVKTLKTIPTLEDVNQQGNSGKKEYEFSDEKPDTEYLDEAKGANKFETNRDPKNFCSDQKRVETENDEGLKQRSKQQTKTEAGEDKSAYEIRITGQDDPADFNTPRMPRELGNREGGSLTENKGLMEMKEVKPKTFSEMNKMEDDISTPKQVENKARKNVAFTTNDFDEEEKKEVQSFKPEPKRGSSSLKNGSLKNSKKKPKGKVVKEKPQLGPNLNDMENKPADRDF